MNTFFIILTIFMIAGALVAVFTRWLISSVVAVGAVGFLVAIAFLLMGAPDLAITQVVVEIISLVILVRATINRDTTVSNYRVEIFAFGAMAAVTAVLLVFSTATLMAIHPFGEAALPVAQHYLDNALKETGAANVVTSIVLDYRGYDTLGEATVIFVAIVGALALLRKKR